MRYTGAVFPHIKLQSVIQIDGRGIRRHSGQALGQRGVEGEGLNEKERQEQEELGIRN
jgi:hypothetical protein